MTTKAQREVQEKYTQILKAFERHPRRAKLVLAGQHRDSLLRALIPLYVAQRYGAQNLVTCGVTQKVWRAFGVRVQSTVMAKALREHIGYARRCRPDGHAEITPNGVKYVEAALKR
jgi:hypothetical protein